MGGGQHLLVPKSADVTVDTSTSGGTPTADPLDIQQVVEEVDHQNLSYSTSEFYASLPRNHQQKSLLCCVCHEHNTTFRYEVVYKNSLQDKKAKAALGQPNSKTTTTRAVVANNSGPEEHAHHNKNTSTNLILHNNNSPSTLTDLVRQQVTLTTSVDTDCTDDSNHEYYNFPPRHPRHGHLKWSVWRPALVTSSSSSTASPSPFPFPPTAGVKEAIDNNNSQRSVVHESICITTYPDYPVHLSTFTLKRVASVIKQNKGRRKLFNFETEICTLEIFL